MPSNEDFFKHLPACPKCRAVIAYLKRDLELRLWMHHHRN
jgi:hypothetical protein